MESVEILFLSDRIMYVLHGAGAVYIICYNSHR